MRVSDLLAHCNRVQLHAAVYDDLVAYLAKVLRDGTEIPVEVGDGNVPEEVIQSVLEKLEKHRDMLLGGLNSLGDVEVPDVPEAAELEYDHDFDPSFN